jgi:DNA-binding HxlR family transcriptional regulator
MRPGLAPGQPPRGPEVIDLASVRAAVKLIGYKWVLSVLEVLTDGPRRKADIHRAIGSGLTLKVLSDTLVRMQAARLISRGLLDDTTTAVGYHLTPLGRSLLEPLAALDTWMRRHGGQ